ncbi:NADase-type glycan-binding domain-containing protein [Aquimarina algiphila]|uniref:Hint domain-containing protein n=1 Tax=Aquimarina algiphila TaxID=2047982 RepID=A0A554VFS1_9FLAO|nr:hypothetical protein [Aquimarina algiphila]TSE06112.1 hypothetical protein FOF46_20405 [Aquimarina algiphila]
MKNVLFYMLLTMTFSTTAQEIITLTPSIEILDLNPADEKEFNRNKKACEEIWERMSNGLKEEDLTAAEKVELEMVDETMASYWDIEGQGCSWYCGGGPTTETASSTLPSQGTVDYNVDNIHDLNYKNVWVEGVAGYGVGEYIEYGFNQSSPRITEIIVVNGHVKSEKAWRNNSRVKKLKMYIKGEPYAILNLTDQRAAQHFKVDTIGFLDRNIDYIAAKKLPQWKMRFEILEVYPGDKYEDTVISEIYFDGIDVHCFAKGTLVTMADGHQEPIENLKIGDKVLSFDQDTNTNASATIEELANPIHEDLIKISFADSTSITCTKDHPFLSADGNWLSYAPQKTQMDYQFDTVEQLTIGMILKTNKGKQLITDIDQVLRSQQTYTIVQLDKGTTFFANDIVVGTEPLRILPMCKKHKMITE